MYYVLLILVSLIFIMSGYMKVSANAITVAGFAKAHLPLWFMYFIGIAEILGGIALWIPKFSKLSTYGLYIIMLGAIVVTVLFDNPIAGLVPIVFIVLLTVIQHIGKKKVVAQTM